MLQIHEICTWAQTKPGNRNFIEGERVLNANHIIKCGKNADSTQGTASITAYCLQTSHLREKPHQIDGVFSDSGKIETFLCSCKAGRGERCKHILATLLFCTRHTFDELEELSCTDKACVWKDSFKESVTNYIDYHPLLEHQCFRDETVKVYNIDEARREDIRRRILQELPNSAFSLQVKGRHKPITLTQKSDKIGEIDNQALEALFLNQRSELLEEIARISVDDRMKCCCDNYAKLQGDYLKICLETMQFYSEWQKERQFRITASKCYELFTYSNNKKPNWTKKCKSYFAIKNFKSQFTDYGKEKEKEARERFKEVTNFKVVQTGLVICKQNPWLACSPDAVLFHDTKPIGLLEIKCPFKGKNMTVLEAIKHEFGQCLVFSDDKYSMKKKHKYYAQVQLGMTVLNVKIAFFFIYSAFDKSYYNISVPFDQEFVVTMLSTLKYIYFNVMPHEICLKNEKQKENDENNNGAVNIIPPDCETGPEYW